MRHLAAQTPEWWTPPDATDPETVETAKAVENGVTTLLHEKRAGAEPWTMRLSEHDANAWLAARLRDWIENQDGDVEWPRQVTGVLLDLRAGALTIGVSVNEGEKAMVVSATLAPRVDGEGALWIPATSFHIGQLTVPGSWILRASDSPLRAILPKEAATSEGLASALDVLSGDAPLARRPWFRLSDGRRVRVVNIQVEMEQLLVTCQELVGDSAE